MSDDNTDDTQQLVLDLGQAIRDTIDTYVTGHDIPVELIVGLLHCIAHEIMIDHDWDDFDDWEDDDEF